MGVDYGESGALNHGNRYSQTVKINKLQEAHPVSVMFNANSSTRVGVPVLSRWIQTTNES